MPFVSINSPSTLQPIVDEIVGVLSLVEVYRDDVVVFSVSFSDRIEHYLEVLSIAYAHGLMMKLRKCQFSKNEITILGNASSRSIVMVDSGKAKRIMCTPLSESQAELTSFSGVAGYYRRFITLLAEFRTVLHAAILREANSSRTN